MPFARIVAWIVLTALLSFAPASGQNAAPAYVEPANLNALVAAAAKEGTLDLAVGDSFGGATGAQIMQDHINKRYHINLVIHYSPINGGVPFVLQLLQEVRAGQTASSDVMFAATNSAVIPYVQQIDWRKFVPGLPESAMIYNEHAVKVLAALNAFSYNTKLVPADQVPKSFADLLNPRWKGKIATSPYQGSFMNYIGLPSVFGHQGMLDYVKKFAQQISGLMTCGGIDRVVSGEFTIFGLDCGDHEVRLRQRKGEPVASIYPKEGTQLNYVDPAIPNTAAHPNAARLFVAFMLTREGQDILWDQVGEDSDLIAGSHMGKFIADLRRGGVKIIEGVQGTGLDVGRPELLGYTKEINDIITVEK
jgi:ABC-type thiamine transport system substrate-binding protein